MSNRLKDLEIYQLAESFSDEIWFIVLECKWFAKDPIGKQLVHSADSIGANIAEGLGRFHFKENKNFCYFSRGSLIKTKGWLNKAKIRKLIFENQFDNYLNKLSVIQFKTQQLHKHIGSMT